MEFLRRPFFVVLIGLVVFISIWYHQESTDVPASAGKQPVECVGRVDDIQMGESGIVLVLSEVQAVQLNSQQNISVKKLLVYDCSKQNLFLNSRQGNKLRIRGTFTSFEKAGNPGEFDAFSYYSCKGISGRIFAESASVLDSHCNYFQYILSVFRQRAVEQLFVVMEEEDAGILSAMLFGERAYLPEEDKELYQRTGVGHILVISGLHISLLGAGLFFLLRSYVMSMKRAVFATMVFLFVYGQFTGFQVAAVRAVFMMCCSLFARYTGRNYDPLSALSLIAVITLIKEPGLLFQCGFLLSYSAVFGILLFAPVIERADIKSGLLQSFVSSAAVTVVTLPVMLWFYYEICPYSVFANMVILPFVSLLIVSGMAGCALCFVFPSAGAYILAAAHYILKFYEMVCRFVDSLPMSRILTGRPSVLFMIAYYAVLAVTIWAFLKWEKKQCVLAGAAALCAASIFIRRDPVFLYTQLDVGQGDCACIFCGDQTFLVDGGSSSEKEIGKYVIQKFLKYYGRSTIDGVFVSHSDADHTNGIVELAQNKDRWGISVNCVFVPNIRKRDENYEELRKVFARNGIPVRKIGRGDVLSRSGLCISCLRPAPDYDWKSENDYSLTLDIAFENIRILCTGDLEQSGEGVLGKLPGPYDVLKVGHHGSKTSTSAEFLSQVSPKNAFISAGRNNRYGHPASEILDRLSAEGARIWSTMDDGAIFVECGGDGKRIDSFWIQKRYIQTIRN